MRLALFSILLLAAPAFAGDTVADDDDTDDLFKTAENKGNNADVPDAQKFRDDDDVDMPSFNTAPKVDDKERDLSAFADPRASIGSTTRMPLDVVGKDVLGDNWAPTIVISDKDAVVIEMPVLYARNRGEFDGVAYWLVLETFADGKKVAEQRMQVTRDAIADKGPSIQFFRTFTPVQAAAGLIEVKVGKSTSSSAKPTPIFTRSVSYKVGA